MNQTIKMPIELLRTRSAAAITGVCYGKILEIEEETDTIWVDYAENPLKKRLAAQLATPFFSLEHLKDAMDRARLVQLAFVENDPAKPVIRDIYFSLVDQVMKNKEEIPEKTVHLKADRIILEGTSEVIIQSGDVRSVYKADEGELVEEAEDIRSTARKNHRIKGGSLFIN